MPYKDLVTGDDYLYKTILPHLFMTDDLSGLKSFLSYIDIEENLSTSEIDIVTDYSLLPYSFHKKPPYPLAVRINDKLLFISGYHMDGQIDKFYHIKDKVLKEDEKISGCYLVIIGENSVQNQGQWIKNLSWDDVVDAFSYELRNTFGYKVLLEKLHLDRNEGAEQREEEEVSFDVIKSMCRIHKEKVCVIYKGGTATFTFATIKNLEKKKFNYILSDDPLLANKKPDHLIRGDVFLLLLNKKKY
ncbi:hypothetical protein PRVXH_000841 [Proteinivorax hydrogeniformans]|uniref:Uncharacterized protein n=1 Tax=Proteinivorax hydrogeniformans TaxID=1826727 RepID=A0AAU8HVW6_9FIRM